MCVAVGAASPVTSAERYLVPMVRAPSLLLLLITLPETDTKQTHRGVYVCCMCVWGVSVFRGVSVCEGGGVNVCLCRCVGVFVCVYVYACVWRCFSVCMCVFDYEPRVDRKSVG